MARLIVDSGGERREIAVAGPVVLGRLKTCGLALEDKTVSREHARVFRDGLRYVAQDLESVSGTFLNGRRLRGPATLSNGDLLKIGPFSVRFEFDEPDKDSATALDTEPVAAASPAPAKPGKIRPRGPGETTMIRGPSPFARFAMAVILLVVFAGVALASRLGFGWILDRVLS